MLKMFDNKAYMQAYKRYRNFLSPRMRGASEPSTEMKRNSIVTIGQSECWRTPLTTNWDGMKDKNEQASGEEARYQTPATPEKLSRCNPTWRGQIKKH
jgi:hypothetical protein